MSLPFEFQFTRLESRCHRLMHCMSSHSQSLSASPWVSLSLTSSHAMAEQALQPHCITQRLTGIDPREELAHVATMSTTAVINELTHGHSAEKKGSHHELAQANEVRQRIVPLHTHALHARHADRRCLPHAQIADARTPRHALCTRLACHSLGVQSRCSEVGKLNRNKQQTQHPTITMYHRTDTEPCPAPMAPGVGGTPD
jgi:hypothetical protein